MRTAYCCSLQKFSAGYIPVRKSSEKLFVPSPEQQTNKMYRDIICRSFRVLTGWWKSAPNNDMKYSQSCTIVDEKVFRNTTEALNSTTQDLTTEIHYFRMGIFSYYIQGVTKIMILLCRNWAQKFEQETCEVLDDSSFVNFFVEFNSNWDELNNQ